MPSTAVQWATARRPGALPGLSRVAAAGQRTTGGGTSGRETWGQVTLEDCGMIGDIWYNLIGVDLGMIQGTEHLRYSLGRQ